MGNVESQYETTNDSPRVVLLGASNVSRFFPSIVRTSQQLLGEPLEFVVAKGHGRSYGKESYFFRKKICGILQSGLWDFLRRRPKSQTRALITDVGNDIVYGVPVETIIQWVGECVERLQLTEAQIVMTDLPMSTIRQLGNARYRILRTILFPSCRLRLEQIQHRAEQLSRALNELAKKQKVTIFKPKIEWYGLDPIHVRRRFCSAFLFQILRSWNTHAKLDRSKDRSGCQAMYLRCLKPEAWSIFGIERRAGQPSGRLQNGTTIALF